MKALIVLALATAARAGIAGQSVLESGVSTMHRMQDVWGNYHFAYDEKHTSGGSWRKESGDAAGNTIGSYGLTDADGRVRIVNYVADAHGFRASVATNEPGTAASSPAGVGINAPPGPIGPPIGRNDDGAGAGLAAAGTAPVAVAAPFHVTAPAPLAVAAHGPVVAPASVALAPARIPTIAAAPAVTYGAVAPVFPAAPAVTAAKFLAAFPAAPARFAANIYGRSIGDIVGYGYGKHK